MTPVIGLSCSPAEEAALEAEVLSCGARSGTFASTQPPRLLQLIASALGVADYSNVLSWELELFDTQLAQVGGMDKELIFAPRIDDKLCSWAALEGLIESAELAGKGGSVAMVGLFDDEEIGSRLRQGAGGNFMQGVVERIVDTFAREAGGGGRVVSWITDLTYRECSLLICAL